MLETKTHIARILQDASSALASLMKAAIDEARFGDVAYVARVADALRGIQADVGESASTVEAGTRMNGKSSAAHGRRPAAAKARAKRYPLFERDGDKLVKIGWSKKNRSTYEHRTPFTSIVDLLEKLDSISAQKQQFTVDDIVPARDKTTGEEIPAYQVYLVLAWLRSIGVVKKNGRDGYVLAKSSSKRTIHDIWDNMGTQQ